MLIVYLVITSLVAPFVYSLLYEDKVGMPPLEDR